MLPPSGSIIVTKVNGNNDFYEDILDCTDINAVSITGTQTILGQKTFNQDIIVSGIEGLSNQPLTITSSGTQPIDFKINGINKLSLLSDGQLSLKSHTGYTGSDLKVVTSGIQTTNNTSTECANLSLDDNSAYWFEIFTIGRKTSNGTFKIRMEINRGCVYREAASVATLIGVVDNSLTRSLSAGAYDIVIDVSGNTLRVMVMGATGETVNWTTSIFYQKIATNT